ncbi:ABC transporter substrate-binding protein [Candidatus Caldatribacterium sp. SIUC1]|uniref:ABC transporter substrate-binding protein n=1 Tax=Candidatus Caldatribacterium sp. SIUC1 TaxID=3418365 RepID=UPI003F68DC31
MRHRGIVVGGLLVVLVLVCSFAVLAQEKFGLKDIPEIKNKKPINMIVETGAAWDKVIEYIKQFETVTGVKVNIERVASPVVYSKENVELMAGTGYYDVVYVETSWTCEWSDYLFDLEELAAKYDPKGVEGFREDIQNISPVLLRCGQAYGKQMVLPFYTYHMGMFLRQDVYDDPTEQAAFKAKYGYDLKPPTTYKELYDQAEFFTRKKGDTLKGKTLDHDLYGVAMMAGAYQINDEISCWIWGMGGDYATVVKNPDGTIKEFVITKKDKDVLKQALTQYKDLLKFAPAGCLTANFDFACAQQGEGFAIIQPHQFASLFTWTADLLKEKVPDGRLGIYPTVGGQPYTGAWSLGVAKASKNPEAAYWLVRYIASYDCQKVLMKEGGQFSARMDLLLDPEFHSPETEYPLGLVCSYLVDIWKQQAPYVDNYWYFNTRAGGKVYEMQMNVLHKPMAEEVTIDECVQELVAKTIELTSKFDTVPIREE